jgi:hypothetical protein
VIHAPKVARGLSPRFQPISAKITEDGAGGPAQVERSSA